MHPVNTFIWDTKFSMMCYITCIVPSDAELIRIAITHPSVSPFSVTATWFKLL